MARYKIEFERNKCIGARSCNVACPDNWEMKEDGKSNFLKEEFDENKLECNMEAAKNCPVKAIHIINADTNKKLI